MRVNEQALLIIVTALNNYSEEHPYDNKWSDDEKAEATFSHWALDEILGLVWDHPWTMASDTVEDFILKCQLCQVASKLPEQKRIFSIAKWTALEILDAIKEVET